MTTFQPTHVITLDRESVEVMLTSEGSAYQRHEWDATEASDFERMPDGRWLFQGRAFNGRVESVADRTPITTCMRPGRVYRVEDLTLMGWTRGDGSGVGDPPYGYNLADYLDADGRYLGPDAHGIEPMVQIAGYTQRQYRIAYVAADGSWDVVRTFAATDDDAANAYAAQECEGDDDWFVLDSTGRNINGGNDQEDE